MEIGEVLKFRRECCYLSRRQLAELSGIHPRTITYAEQGSRKTYKYTLDALDKALTKREAEIAQKKKELNLI